MPIFVILFPSRHFIVGNTAVESPDQSPFFLCREFEERCIRGDTLTARGLDTLARGVIFPMMKRASDEAAVFHVAIGEIRAIMATIGTEDPPLAGSRPQDDHMPVEEFRPVKGAGRHLVGHGDRIPAGIETPLSLRGGGEPVDPFVVLCGKHVDLSQIEDEHNMPRGRRVTYSVAPAGARRNCIYVITCTFSGGRAHQDRKSVV